MINELYKKLREEEYKPEDAFLQGKKKPKPSEPDERTMKFERGDAVTFHVATDIYSEAEVERDLEDNEEYNKWIEHDMESAVVTGTSEIGPGYYDIIFEDGFEISGLTEDHLEWST